VLNMDGVLKLSNKIKRDHVTHFWHVK
jgi:hypothetical protein